MFASSKFPRKNYSLYLISWETFFLNVISYLNGVIMGQTYYYKILNLSLLTLIFLSIGCVEKVNKKMNVLILFSDQHNKNTMGFENHPDVITPSLDKLAAESLVFDNAYCPAGVSTPSRASFITGLYPRTVGLLSNEEHTSVVENAVSMAAIFKNNGYSPFAFGDRHIKSSV